MFGTRFRSLYILYNSYTKIKESKPLNTTLQNKLGTKMFKLKYFITESEKWFLFAQNFRK